MADFSVDPCYVSSMAKDDLVMTGEAVMMVDFKNLTQYL
jgi:hypothetical protein